LFLNTRKNMSKYQKSASSHDEMAAKIIGGVAGLFMVACTLYGVRGQFSAENDDPKLTDYAALKACEAIAKNMKLGDTETTLTLDGDRVRLATTNFHFLEYLGDVTRTEAGEKAVCSIGGDFSLEVGITRDGETETIKVPSENYGRVDQQTIQGLHKQLMEALGDPRGMHPDSRRAIQNMHAQIARETSSAARTGPVNG
jgi:hypothetical protein